METTVCCEKNAQSVIKGFMSWLIDPVLVKICPCVSFVYVGSINGSVGVGTLKGCLYSSAGSTQQFSSLREWFFSSIIWIDQYEGGE